MMSKFTKFKKRSLIALLAILAVGAMAYASAFLFFSEDFEQANGNIPYPGTWNFHYEVGPPGAGSGPAGLALSATGNLATMNIDGQTVVFHRVLDSELAIYQTNRYTFPLPEPDYTQPGIVWFKFAANTPTSIIGSTFADNRKEGILEYTWAMELDTVDLDFFDTPYELTQGIWDISYEHVDNDCGPDGSPADFGSFSWFPDGQVALSNTYDFDTGAPDPDNLFIESIDTDWALERIGDTNMFAQEGEGIGLGLPSDPDGELLLDFEDQTFMGQFEFNASGENNMEGLLHVTGSGGCNATFLVEMSYAGPAPSV